MKTKEELEKEFEILTSKHGKVYTVTAPLNDEGTEFATVYLRKPDIATTQTVMKFWAAGNTIKGTENALKTLYIGGDDLNLILKDEDALLAVDFEIGSVFERRKAEIKKN